MGRINNIPALVQIMAWRRSGDKPLFEPMMVTLLMHICVTQPQWVDKLTKAQSQVQLGLQPNCSNTCQVWTWYSTDKQLFYIIQNREKFMIWGNWFSNPFPELIQTITTTISLNWCNWASWCLKSPTTWIVLHNLVQTKNNTPKLCITAPLWGESTMYWWIPHTKGQ